MDESYADFLAADPGHGGDPASLNLPAFVDGTCVATCTWTRTVRNVADVPATYEAATTAPDGFAVALEPAEFTVAPGATQDVTVTVTADLATVPLGQPSFAEVRLSTDATHANGRAIAPVHFPVVVTPREEVPPSLTVTPGGVTATQRVDETATHTFTLDNGGNTDLEWELFADGDLRRPRGAATPVETAPLPAGLMTGDDGSSSLAASGAEGDAVVPRRDTDDDRVTQTLTHSASQAVVAGNAIACSADDGATTSANSYLRTFTLADFGVDGAFDVTEVEFGVENLTVAQDLTVGLYTLRDPAAPLTRANLEPVGTATQSLQPQRQTLATVPVTGAIPAGSTLVVEVSAPDLTGVGGFWPGTNSAGQSAPTYLAAPGCGVTEPADLGALGFPWVHLVMNVVGTTDAPACNTPADLPWLDVAPLSGSVGPDATGRLEVTVDTAGVPPSRLGALLCLRTNDPDDDLTTIPLSVTVIGDSGLTGDAEQTRLTTDGLPDDQQGNAVAIDGDTAVVGASQADVDEFGASGAAYVYVRDADGDGWDRQATLLPDGERDWGLVFGRSVAIDGDTIVVGATGAAVGDSRPGAAYVFVRDGDTWTQQAKLSTPDVRWGAEFGFSVAVDGDTVAVGVPGEHLGDDNAAGVVYPFTRDGGTWTIGPRLAGSGVSSFGNFGWSVSLDGGTLLVGAPNSTARGVFRQGAAYVFTDDGDGGWTERAMLLPSDPAPELAFGTSVDVDGGTAVVGASGPGLDYVPSHGAAYVYEGDGAAWAEQAKLTSTGTHVNDRFGWSVGVDGGTVVVGAPYQGRTAGVDLGKGAAVVFTRDGDGWTQLRTLRGSDTAQGDHLGTAVAVSGDDVLAGAPNAHVGDVADQGAAYVFVPGADAPAPPSITVTPGEVAASLPPGGSTTRELTIGNGGERELRWAIDAAATVSGPLRPAGTTTVVESGPASPTPSDAAPDAWAPLDAETAATDGTAPLETDAVRLTHSAALDVDESTIVPVCQSTQTGTTRENRFLRTFTLADFGVEGAFDVDEVTFGLQLVVPSADLTVNLYTLDGPFEYVNLTRLGTATVTVEDGDEGLVTVPVDAQVPAGATLVLEVAAPDLLNVGAVVPGANSAGQTGPSYISAPDCGAANPVTMESLGFPDAHLVMAVDGTPLEPIRCDRPDWLSTDPAEGTVAPGEEVAAVVTLDAAGLAPGEYAAHLCVASNDPAAPVTAVPVSLTVEAPGEPELDVETFLQRGIWYATLTWTGIDAERVDVERDGLVVATVANTGTHVDQIGRPRIGESFTYRICAAGTDTCSAPVTVFPRGEIRGPDRR
jgi:hypothetical protein